MTLIEEHMLPALHTGPAHHTLLNIVSWCSALDNLNVSYVWNVKIERFVVLLSYFLILNTHALSLVAIAS